MVYFMHKFMMLLLLNFTVAVQAESVWQLVKKDAGIAVYTSQKPNFPLKHFKAETSVNKDVSTILAALQDAEACV